MWDRHLLSPSRDRKGAPKLRGLLARTARRPNGCRKSTRIRADKRGGTQMELRREGQGSRVPGEMDAPLSSPVLPFPLSPGPAAIRVHLRPSAVPKVPSIVIDRSTVAECTTVLTRKLVVLARKFTVLDQKVGGSGQKVVISDQKVGGSRQKSTSFPLFLPPTTHHPPPTTHHPPPTHPPSNREFPLPFQKVPSFRQKSTSFPLFCHTFKGLHKRGRKKSCFRGAVPSTQHAVLSTEYSVLGMCLTQGWLGG